jgi:carboxyl-terminal processing protease
MVAAVLTGALVTGGWLVRGAGGDARLAGPLAGIITGRAATGPVDGRRLFDDVMTKISDEYVDTLGVPTLYRKAVDGMLEELNDPHSVYLDPERFAGLTERTTGTYGGIGIEINARESAVEVVTPLPNTPAARAGLETGDRITEIGGRPTAARTLEEASKLLRGPAGSAVTLVVERPGVATRLPFRIVREEIRVSPVQHATMLGPSVGYVDVSVFADSTAAELARAVAALEKQGMKSLVLDLRGNPGGLLDEGVAVADLFLDAGQGIVRTRGRAPDANRAFADRAPQRWPTLPLVVLIDRGSASASEIVAGALQDHDRAVLVGTTSYGKGSAQTLLPLPQGGALKLTTALWYTPSGRSIPRPRATHLSEDDDEEVPATDSAAGRPRFKTDAGRVVLGAGGIMPDVAAGDTAVAPATLALQQALGKQLPRFRDALTAYASALAAPTRAAGRPFEVTPAIRAELARRVRAAGVQIPTAVYDGASSFVERTLTYEVTRLAFGPNAELIRRTQNDPVIAAALALTAGEVSREELLRRAASAKRADDPRAAADSTR